MSICENRGNFLKPIGFGSFSNDNNSKQENTVFMKPIWSFPILRYRKGTFHVRFPD